MDMSRTKILKGVSTYVTRSNKTRNKGYFWYFQLLTYLKWIQNQL